MESICWNMINYCNGASIPQWRAETSWGIKTEFNQDSGFDFSGTLKVHLSMNCNGALQASNPTNFCNIYLVGELNETTYCKKRTNPGDTWSHWRLPIITHISQAGVQLLHSWSLWTWIYGSIKATTFTDFVRMERQQVYLFINRYCSKIPALQDHIPSWLIIEILGVHGV